ncbi:hypothetical protein PISL3812_05135 [Talaromyces islandicus]|uniref:Uncharacterized protein n=1 Tax=Talaromyces islandicus TaxID=28573 RepID=A0A0U1LXK4_TALIS|nr:hypothetical protein PISL3812_05135 [Talaromyces islandicus]
MAGNDRSSAANPGNAQASHRQPARRTEARQPEDPNPSPEDRIASMEEFIGRITTHIRAIEQQLDEKTEQLNQLEAQVMASSATPAAITAQAVAAAEGRIKLPKPITFDGTRSKLKTFLVNIDMHLDASNLTDEKKKIIFVASCFTDAAAE